MKVLPFHSTKASDAQVFHDNDQCVDGSNIEGRFWARGKGDLPHCAQCARPDWLQQSEMTPFQKWLYHGH